MLVSPFLFQTWSDRKKISSTATLAHRKTNRFRDSISFLPFMPDLMEGPHSSSFLVWFTSCQSQSLNTLCHQTVPCLRREASGAASGLPKPASMPFFPLLPCSHDQQEVWPSSLRPNSVGGWLSWSTLGACSWGRKLESWPSSCRYKQFFFLPNCYPQIHPVTTCRNLFLCMSTKKKSTDILKTNV